MKTIEFVANSPAMTHTKKNYLSYVRNHSLNTCKIYRETTLDLETAGRQTRNTYRNVHRFLEISVFDMTNTDYLNLTGTYKGSRSCFTDMVAFVLQYYKSLNKIIL